MRLSTFVAAAALAIASLAARAESMITYTFTGNGVFSVYGGDYFVTTSPVLQFNPSLGTLDSVTFDLSGTASSTSDFDNFAVLASAQDPTNGFITGSGSEMGGGVFTFSTSGTDTYQSLFDQYLEGTGQEQLALTFVAPTTTSGTAGTVTYNYTPVAATPEPSSIALLGTGLLGVAGVVRRRLV